MAVNNIKEIDANPDLDDDGELDVESYPLPEGLVGDMTDEEWDAIPVDEVMLKKLRVKFGIPENGPGT